MHYLTSSAPFIRVLGCRGWMRINVRTRAADLYLFMYLNIFMQSDIQSTRLCYNIMRTVIIQQ